MRAIRLAAVTLTLAGTAGLTASAASACSSDARSPLERVDRAALAVTGRVTEVHRVEPNGGEEGRYEARFRVSRVYKGRTGTTIRLEGGTGGCGFGRMVAGQRLGLVLDGGGDRYAIFRASAVPSRALEAVTRGRWRPPGTGRVDPGCIGVGGSPTERLALARRAVVARVLQVAAQTPPPPLPGAGAGPQGRMRPVERPFVATLRVLAVFKGASHRTIRIVGLTGGGRCAFGPLAVGDRVGLLLGSQIPRYAVQRGSRSSPGELDAATGGRSHPPR